MEKIRFFKFCDIFSEDDIVLPDIICSIMLEAFPNGSKFARILWLKLMNEALLLFDPISTNVPLDVFRGYKSGTLVENELS